MRRQVQDSVLPAPWSGFLLRHLRVLAFVVLGSAGMLAAYLFYSPTPDGRALAVAAGGPGGLSAPIVKQAPDRPVTQRFRQSRPPLFIALISGHLDSDSGAVCDDGLTEAEVNRNIAELTLGRLRQLGIPAAIFAEFDPRLNAFSGTALISIHADSCVYYNDLATGYKIAGSSLSDSVALEKCLERSYGAATRLSYHANTITVHMTDYHAFRLIAPGTPAVILETGFMNLDRQLLVDNPEVVAGGIVNGIMCFLEQAS